MVLKKAESEAFEDPLPFPSLGMDTVTFLETTNQSLQKPKPTKAYCNLYYRFTSFSHKLEA